MPIMKTELIALANHCGHSMVITTHSPYVLGSLNNLLYAYQTEPEKRKQALGIIPEELWLDSTKFSAWFVKNGGIENCMDDELPMIQNEKIDEISNPPRKIKKIFPSPIAFLFRL